METAVPLEEQDIRILDVEGPAIVGHTCKVIRLESPGIDFTDLYESVEAKIPGVPELRWKLGEADGTPAWVRDDSFDLARHLVDTRPGARLTVEELSVTSGELFTQRLERDRPMWQIDVVGLDDGGTALIWRIHHALADGTTAMRLASEVLWEETATPSGATPAARAVIRKADDARRHRHLVRLFEREFSREPGPSPFDGVIGTDREIAFATISLSELHDAGKRAANATLNDSVLSVVSGAIRHWMELHDRQHLGPVRCRVPVSMHHAGEEDGGNRDSFFSVPLPLNEPDPVKRLREIQAETGLRKADHDAEELDSLLRRISHTSPRLRRYYSKFEANPRRFALNISNVRGPSNPVTVLDAPVQTVHSIADIGERHALRVAALSVGDRLCFGFCADPDLISDVDQMAAGIEWATGRLVRAAAGAN